MRIRTTIVALCLVLTAAPLVGACDPREPGPQHPGDGDSAAPDVDASDPQRSDSATPHCPAPGQIAVAEICNAFDDDCDGVIDEGACDDPCDVFDGR